MNKKALIGGIAYSVLIIVLKLAVVLGGYSLNRFFFLYLNIICNVLLIPFYIFVIKHVRDKDFGGVIGGRDALRLSLTVFAVAAVTVSIYNYIQYEWKDKDMAIEYYNSQAFTDFLKTKRDLKPEKYPDIINEEIVSAQGAAFKATTGKLFAMMIIGLSSALIVAAMMKRRPSQPG